MKKLAFIVFTLCLPALAWAATGEPLATIQWNGTAHDGVFALARRGDELWAATNFGLLLKRGSKPWETAVKSNGNALLGIGFSPQGDGIAVGQNGLLMEVKPNSENWKTQNSGVKHRLMWVASNSRGDFLVVGAFGTVLYRAAGSDQWQKVAVKSSQGEEPHLYGAFFVSDDEALVVGENESLLDFDKGNIVQQVELGQPPASASSKSSPGGDQGDTVVTPSLFTVTYCDGMLVAAGQRGLVLSKSLAAETKATPKPAPKRARAKKAGQGRQAAHGTSGRLAQRGDKRPARRLWLGLHRWRDAYRREQQRNYRDRDAAGGNGPRLANHLRQGTVCALAVGGSPLGQR